MFCPKCGANVQEGFDYCPKCGYDMKNINNSQPIEQKANINPTQSQDVSQGEKMTREEFAYSRPHLKAKMDQIKNSKIVVQICDAIILIICCFVVFNNYNKSYYRFYDFFKWVAIEPQKLFVPMIVGAIVGIISSFAISIMMTSKPNEEINKEYAKYCSGFSTSRNINIKDNNLGWECPKCGAFNTPYSNTCVSCSTHRPMKKSVKNVAGQDEWICPNCGVVNQNYTGTCGCGTRKPN